MRLRALLLALAVCVLFTQTANAAELHPFKRGSFAAILATNEGKPAVINFWSITCPPCLAEMPQWRALAEDHPEIGLVLVSTDSFEDEARIQQVLRRYGLDGIGSWVFAEAHKTRLRYDIDKTWRGELPRTYLITASGETEGRSGMISHVDLNAWLERQ